MKINIVKQQHNPNTNKISNNAHNINNIIDPITNKTLNQQILTNKNKHIFIYIYIYIYIFYHIQYFPIFGIMQLIDKQIIQGCKKMMKGEQISPQLEKSIQQLIMHPANTELITKLATKQIEVLLAFQALARSGFRSGTYFGGGQMQKMNVLVSMLDILGCVPPYEAKDQSNAYLSFVGVLLASYCHMFKHNGFLTFFFNTKLFNSNIPANKQLKFLTKILTSCLDQLTILHFEQVPYSSYLSKSIFFQKEYSQVFLNSIHQLILNVYSQMASLENRNRLLLDIFELQQSFLNLSGKGDIQSISLQSRYRSETLVLHGQANHFVIWVRFNCRVITQIVSQIFQKKQMNVSSTINKMLCVGVSIIVKIFQLNYKSSLQNVTKSYQQIKQILLSDFFVPFLNNFKSITRDDQLAIYLPQQLNSSILNLIFSQKSKIFFEQYILLMKLNRHNMAASQGISNLVKYAKLIIQNNQCYFTEFKDCPVGLSVKLVHNIRYKVMMICEQLFHQVDEDEKSQWEIGLVKMQHIFYFNFVMEKTLMGKIPKQAEQIFEKQQDYYSYFDNLNHYFDQLSMYSPNFLSQQHIHTLFYQDINEMQLDFTRKQYKGEQEVKEYLNDRFNQFMNNNDGFKVLFRIIEFARSNFKQTRMKKIGNINQPKRGEKQKQQLKQLMNHIIFSLALVRGLLKQSLQSEVRGHLFYQFFMLSSELKIFDTEHHIRQQVKICKIYILHSYFEQYMPQSYEQYGQNCNSSTIYNSNFCGISLDKFIQIYCNQISQSFQHYQTGTQNSTIDYGLQLLQNVSRRLVNRAHFLYDEDYFNFKITKSDCITKINTIFNSILKFDIDSQSCLQKLYALAGMLAQLCPINCLYDTYDKMVYQTISNPSTEWDDFQKLNKYLSAATGLLSGIVSSFLYQNASELILLGLIELKQTGLLNILPESYYYILKFLDQLISHRILDCKNSSIPLQIYQIFFQGSHNWLAQAFLDKDLQKQSAKIYKKMCLLKINKYLIPLPSSPQKLRSYPEILSQYFNSLSRVQNSEILHQFSTCKLDWLISYLQSKIQKNEPYEINLRIVAINTWQQINDNLKGKGFPSQIYTKVIKLCCLLGVVANVPSTRIGQQFDQARKEVGDMLCLDGLQEEEQDEQD